MSAPVHLDADALRAALPMAAAVEALAAGFGAAAPADRGDPPRQRVPTRAGELLVMPATGPEGTGVKVVGIAPGNGARGLAAIQGLYLLLDPETLAPAATIDGAALTVLRTAALSGLATRLLARAGASRLVVFGSGPQAIGHVEAMAAVRPLADVTVVARDAGRGEVVAGTARALGLRARVLVAGSVNPTTPPPASRGPSGAPSGSASPTTPAAAGRGPSGEPGEAVRAALAAADVVCTCTAATAPLFAGADLARGVHVNAIGSHRAQDRELDETTIVRARVVVEAREPAWAEAGELALPLAAGTITRDHVIADLAEVVAGATVRRGDGDVTVFKAVGAAFEDLIVAAAAVEAATG